MNFKVNLGVELNGARVEPTSEQRKSVEEFVGKMLLGETSTPRAKLGRPRGTGGKHPLGSRDWTREEEIKFMELYQEFAPTAKSQMQILTQIGQKLGRTSHACLVRLSVIRRGKGYIPSSIAPTPGRMESPSGYRPDLDRSEDHR